MRELSFTPTKNCDEDGSNIRYVYECCYKSYRFVMDADIQDINITSEDRSRRTYTVIPAVIEDPPLEITPDPGIITDKIDYQIEAFTIKDTAKIEKEITKYVKDTLKKDSKFKNHIAKIMGFDPDKVDVYDTEENFNKAFPDVKIKPDKKDHDDTCIKVKD